MALLNNIWGAGMREASEREVVLHDCPPAALEAVLRFCYCGECRAPKQDMLQLLVLADRLDIPALVAVCEKVRAWTPAEVVPLLTIGRLCPRGRLRIPRD